MPDALTAYELKRSGGLRVRGDQAEREREEARARAVGAEGEAKVLREALAEARRPAWHRWFWL